MTDVVTPNPSWRSSLYSRIAGGFLLVIVLILAVEGTAAVWVLRQTRDINGESQSHWRLELTRGLSQRLTRTLEADPSTSLDAIFATLPSRQRFFIVTLDGTALGDPPDIALTTVRHEIPNLRAGSHPPTSWEKSIYAGTPLTVNGHLVGILGIAPLTTLERFWPVFGGIGVGLLAIGVLVLTLAIASPVRAGLHELQRAVRQLGAGDLSARAQVEGAEIGEVAAAFNRMAGDLATRTEAAETADRLRRQLIADVSHELMTPLTSVLGHLETLAMSDVLLDEAGRARNVSIATREAHRLQHVIGDLLNAARLEAGGVALRIESLSTTALFEQVTLRHENQCDEAHISMSQTVESGAEFFAADPFRIEQAIENLVSNALRHTPVGGSVQLSAHVADNAIILDVTDSGEGIAAEHLPYVFDRFYKASAARGIASRGSGLGLSIVKAIVTAHRGRISATSTVGVGTQMRIELPLYDAVQKTA